MQKPKQAFTLVELIVVITILAILGTIAFISLQGYSSTARNSKRVSDIVNVGKGLEIKKIKSGFYEFPENYETFTGTLTKTLKQGELGNKVLTNIGVTTNVKDPLTEEKYKYSVYGNGEYYQIAYELENNIFSSNIKIINKINAEDTAKTIKIKGNYEIDPSLPSLVVIPETVTGSGIFDPEVCFILEGGENNFKSTSIDCQKKKEMSLKNFDEGLVGYWDMESTFNSGGIDYLKDLSGNENNGKPISLSGTITIGGENGKIGKAVYLGGETDNSFFDFYTTGTTLSNIPANGNMTLQAIIYDEKFTTGSLQSPSWGTIFSTYQGDAGWMFRTWTDIGGNRFLTFQSVFTSQRINVFGVPGEIKQNEWYIVTAVFNKLTNSTKLYINGNELINLQKNIIGKGDYNLETYYGTNYNNNGLDIGKLGNGLVQLWHGKLDDLKVYNRVLSDQEIKQQAKVAGF